MFASFLAASLVLAATTIAAQAPVPAAGLSAVGVIRAAVLERLGPDVEVTVTPLSLPAQPALFRAASPDPSAWLGKPMRFSLATGAGPAIGATVDLKVLADRAITTRAIGRGQVLTAEDVTGSKGELRDLPLRRLPTADALVGARALRDMAPGTTVQASFVIVRRVVEPGDKVTVVAAAGAIEVTATLVAADGGQVGDVIRVVNPDTRRYLRGRILRAGFVEVIHER